MANNRTHVRPNGKNLPTSSINFTLWYEDIEDPRSSRSKSRFEQESDPGNSPSQINPFEPQTIAHPAW